MAIDDSGEWSIGSDASDIEAYLRAYAESEEAYPVSAYRAVRCGCGMDRFRLEAAGEVVRRECITCGAARFICRQADDWEEAVEDGFENCTCVECGGVDMNVGVGFARYSEAPEIDAVKWFYVGVRCASCGVLGCFGGGKVGGGPSSEVYDQA